MTTQSRYRISALFAGALLFGAVATISAPSWAQDAAPAAPEATTPAEPDAGAAMAPEGEPSMAAPAEGMEGAAPAEPETATSGPAPDETVKKESPYSLQHLWKEGNIVTRGTMLVLAIMSVGTWYILFNKFFEQARILRQSKSANKTFWGADSIEAGAGKLDKSSAFRALVEDGLNAVRHHEGKLTDQIDLNEWVTMSLQRSAESVNNRLQGGMAFLATVGSTAPFVGLFGTVWGILQALISIGVSGQASIDKVAGPVGEALIMTAIGLAVAVPAVLAYNFLLRRNKLANDQVKAFAADLHSVLIAGGKRGH